MPFAHDPKAAEKLIDQVIKNQSLRETLKKQARAEEAEFQAQQKQSKPDSDPFENLPL